VIDVNVSQLQKNDFGTFWSRETWFRERNLPFRRGYLLHGPPGNGNTSAVRVMMTGQNLDAYTLHFFDSRTEDSNLDDLFDKAYRDRPAMTPTPISGYPVQRAAVECKRAAAAGT
jgi:hypothetical protein